MMRMLKNSDKRTWSLRFLQIVPASMHHVVSPPRSVLGTSPGQNHGWIPLVRVSNHAVKSYFAAGYVEFRISARLEAKCWQSLFGIWVLS